MRVAKESLFKVRFWTALRLPSVWDQEYVVPYLIELTTTCKDIEAWLIRLAFLFDLE